MLIDLLTALLLCGAVTALAYGVARVMFRQGAAGGGNTAAAYTVLAVSGNADDLELTVKTLLHNRDARRVLITDCGLGAESRRMAEILARDYPQVRVCSPNELPQILTE
jgi:hypothetical protein